ncbi:transcription elongation factor GreA [Microvirga antarctica]|uniref:transcription elongation factor GreA n=1 Tax=Microvirga antarctica TaxID=2819233 RepID=UPI001B3186C4|nr:transcription elongation factor GreA [Microvirga antarctica]
MSRAFVREVEGGEAFEELPDRPISAHSNLVTQAGLTRIDAEIVAIAARLSQAQAQQDRAEIARSSRDLRYWSHRRATAEVVPDPLDHTQVRFGATVSFVREDGRRQTYRIVGEDEADPAAGTISYVSPLAQALMGKGVDDTAMLGHGEAVITAIQ